VELITAGYEPLVVDNLCCTDMSLLHGVEKITGKKISFYQGDCRDREFLHTVFSTGAVQGVIHFAALKFVGESVQKPLLYYDNNVGSLVALLEVMKEFGVRTFIFSSSCTVYGQPDRIPVDETAPFQRAESPYGATKQMCERILQDVAGSGFSVISLRYFNPIGAHPSALMGELPLGVPNNLAPYVTQTAAGWRKKLVVFGNDYNTPDGSCIRDFIHVVDLAKAHVKALDYAGNQGLNLSFEAFNLGTGKGVSVLELIETFTRATGVHLPVEIGKRRAGDVEKVYARADKANRMLQWQCTHTLDEALLHAWQWQQTLTPPAHG
jgi:UDP-glucose 4-epimerase